VSIIAVVDLLPATSSRPQASSFVAELLAKGLARSTTSKILSILSQTLRAGGAKSAHPTQPVRGGRWARGEPSGGEDLPDAGSAQPAGGLDRVSIRGHGPGGWLPRPALWGTGGTEASAGEPLRGQAGSSGGPEGGVRALLLRVTEARADPIRVATPFLVEVLRKHIEAYPPVDDLLFTSPEGSLLRRSHFERRIWAPAVEKVGLDPMVRPCDGFSSFLPPALETRRVA
jgi:hypothetical protein